MSSQKYLYDIATLKDYGGEKIKLTLISKQLNSGYEVIKNYNAKNTINDEKLDNNISRARQKIFEYVMCNDFTFFTTFTLNSKKYDRYNLDSFRLDISQFVRNQRKKYKCDIQYLFVPEQHKDGAWHIHGFIEGLPLSALKEFSLNDKKLPKYIRKKLKQGFTLYNWLDYSEKFGFNDLEYVQNREAAAKYVTKYITKVLADTVLSTGSHLYYNSTGLDKAVIIAKGKLLSEVNFDYNNSFVKILWRDNISLSRNYLENKLINC